MLVSLIIDDYHGTWEKYTGVNAPLYSNPNIESGANAILNAVSLIFSGIQ